MGSLWAFGGFSSLPRQEASMDLISHQTTLTKLSSCRWFMLVFGHVHHFAPSPTNLRQTSHCAMYSRFAHRLSLTCACHSLPRVVWVGMGGCGCGEVAAPAPLHESRKVAKAGRWEDDGKNDHGALPRDYHFWPKADSLGSKSINPCLVLVIPLKAWWSEVGSSRWGMHDWHMQTFFVQRHASSVPFVCQHTAHALSAVTL
jgi:hypothetical protein